MTREEEITNAALEECAEQILDCKWAFMHGAKWADKTMIDKACKWLSNNKDHPFIGCEDHQLAGYLTDEFIEDFRKAMEE